MDALVLRKALVLLLPRFELNLHVGCHDHMALTVAYNERHLHDVPGCLTEACVFHRMFTAQHCGDAGQCSACVVLIRWDPEQYGKMLNML